MKKKTNHKTIVANVLLTVPGFKLTGMTISFTNAAISQWAASRYVYNIGSGNIYEENLFFRGAKGKFTFGKPSITFTCNIFVHKGI